MRICDERMPSPLDARTALNARSLRRVDEEDGEKRFSLLLEDRTQLADCSDDSASLANRSIRIRRSDRNSQQNVEADTKKGSCSVSPQLFMAAQCRSDLRSHGGWKASIECIVLDHLDGGIYYSTLSPRQMRATVAASLQACRISRKTRRSSRWFSLRSLMTLPGNSARSALRRTIAPVLCFAFVLSLVGCEGSDSLGRRALTGQVTLDGAPIKQGSIRFESEAGAGAVLATGAPIVDGAYALPREGGLADGKYKVFVTASEPDTRSADEIMNNPGPPAKELVPAKYNVNSELVATIPTDLVDGKLNFALTSK